MSELALPGAKAAGRKLFFISDLHPQFRPAEAARFRQLAALIQAEKPDYLLVGGDGVGDAVHFPKLPELWRRLSDGVPVALALPGNWELGKDWLDADFYRELYGRGGFRYLSNETWSDGKLFLAALADVWNQAVIPALPETPPTAETFNLVGIHRPDALGWVENYATLSAYDLVLSGHLHAGQFRLPLWGPLISIGVYGRRLDYGLYRHRQWDTRLFISAGLGEGTVPWRVNCPREAVIVHLV